MAGDSRDRAAAHAAVRNLAEVYGIDLLPLELNRELITPPKHHESFCSISRRLSEPADWCDHEALSTPIKERGGASFPLTCQLFEDDSTVGSSPATVASASNSRPPSAADIAGPPLLHALQQMVAEGSAECPGDCVFGRQQATSAAFTGRAPNETPSPCPSTTAGPGAGSMAAPYCSPEDTTVDSIATDDLLLSEAEYIEYQMPLEQRIMLLEDERDTLVDKLLSTTEALHALEARNRESQATASQVSALLDQLQELLRRAEAERDRAKMQLRRQRLSVSQIRCEATDVTAASAANAFCSMADIQEHPAGTAVAGRTGPGEESNDSSTVLGRADDGDALLFQREFKRHKSSNGGSDHAGSDVSFATDCAGRSCGRARDAVDSGSSSSSNRGAEAELGAAEDFQPSSNEARPPVKTAIHGFEKLMKQHNHGTAVRGRNSSSGSGSGSSSSGGDCGSSPPKLLRASFEATAAAAAAAGGGGGGATSAGATSAGDAGCNLVSNAALLSHLITPGTTSLSGSSTPAAGTPTSYAAVAASSGVNVSRMWDGSSSSSSNSPRVAPPPLSREPSPKKPAGKGGAVRGFPAHKHSRAASRASPLGPRQPQATNMAADGHCLWDGNTRGRQRSPVARAASRVVEGVADEGGNHSSSERTSSGATAVFSTAAVTAVVQAEGRAGQLQQEAKQGVDVYDPEKFKDAAAAAAVTSRLAPLAGSPSGHLLEHMPSDYLASADSAADGDVEVCAEVVAPGVEQQEVALANKQHGAPCRPEDSCKKKHRSGVGKGLAIAATAAATAHPALTAGEAVHASTFMSSADTAPTVPAPAPQCSRGWPQSWFALAVLALLLLAGASMSVLHGNSRKLDHQLGAMPAEAGKDVASVQALQAQLAAMQQKVVQLEQQLMDQPVCVAPAMAGRSGDTLNDDEL